VSHYISGDPEVPDYIALGGLLIWLPIFAAGYFFEEPEQPIEPCACACRCEEVKP
jgi:hypothetical protein